MPQQRHLAAILFTDIVGYTSMMQKDEQYALSVSRHHISVLNQSVAAYSGEILNDYGDSSLCIFHSATDAVQCAIEIQKQLQTEPVVPLRIGLHIGEIFFEDGKIYGNGVNVASRVQSLAIANSVLVSSALNNNIKNNPEIKTVSVGRFHFKNVDEPMEVFALVSENLVIPDKSKMEGKLQSSKSTSKKWVVAIIVSIMILTGFLIYNNFFSKSSYAAIKSIAVLPFRSIGPENDNELYADAMLDALISEFNKIKSFDTRSLQTMLTYKGVNKTIPDIAKELDVDAILNASLIMTEDTVKINVYLTSADDKQIWSDTFKENLDQILQIYPEIASAICQKISIDLTPQEKEFLEEPRQKVNPVAYKAFLRGKAILFTGDYRKWSDWWAATPAFREAVRIDSSFAEAYAYLARAEFNNPEISDEEGWNVFISLNDKARSLNPDMAQIYLNDLRYYNEIKDRENARLALKKATKIAPNDDQVLSSTITYHYHSGQIRKAVKSAEKWVAQKPGFVDARTVLSFTQYLNHDFEQSLKTLDEAEKFSPDTKIIANRKAWNYSVLNKHQDAVISMDRALKLMGNDTILGITANAAWVFARAGLKGRAEKMIESFKNNCAGCNVWAYANLGEYSKALDYMEDAFSKDDFTIHLVRYSPSIPEALRKLPRYKEILERYPPLKPLDE